MKKVILSLVITAALVSCGGNSVESTATDTSAGGISSDSATQHPDGTLNSNVISTDTAAMNTGKMEEKKDSADKKDALKK